MYQIRAIGELAPAYQSSRLMPPRAPQSTWASNMVVVVAALTNLVRYVDVSYMIYFGLNKLGNTKQPDIIAAIVDDIIVALLSFGLFYAVNFHKKRTAIPYVLFGIVSIGVQIVASHGPAFMPTEIYDIEIRQKLYADREIIGIYSDGDVEISRLIIKISIIITQILFNIVVLAFLIDRNWPL